MTLIHPTVSTKTDHYVMRPATMNDFDAVCALLLANDVATIGEQEFDPEQLRRDWERADFDLASNVRVVATPEGQVVGYIGVRNTIPPYLGNFVFGFTHPDHYGQGIGTLMLDWAEDRARENIHLAPPQARVHAGTEAFYKNHKSAELLENQGYTLTRYFWQMRGVLDQQPAQPLWPEGITVRTFSPWDDLDRGYRVVWEAFKDHWGHADRPFEVARDLWRDYREKDPEFDPSLYFMAMDGDEVAAACYCSIGVSDDPNVGFVDTLGVRRPWRRKGLGKALLLHAFGEFYRRGKTKSALFVDAGSLTGATRLYESVGMQMYHQWNYYEKELRSGEDVRTKEAPAE